MRQRLTKQSPRAARGLRACLVLLLVGAGAGLASAAAGAGGSPPAAPVFGTSVEVIPVSGQVSYTAPGQSPAPLLAAQTLPVGSTVDATSGKVRLIAVDAHGAAHSGELSRGAFTIRQPRSEGGVLELPLVGPLPVCGGFATAAKAIGGRNIWSKADPYFSPNGYSARTQPMSRRHYARDAAGANTTWVTADGCANGRRTTAVRTLQGAVRVSNPITHKTVGGQASVVRAGGHVGCYTLIRLQSQGHGRFITTGRFGSATVRGSADAHAGLRLSRHGTFVTSSCNSSATVRGSTDVQATRG